MRGATRRYGWIAAMGLLSSGCGMNDEDRSTPPPVVGGESDKVFSMEAGTYFVRDVQDLQDGCGKKPLRENDSITQVPFLLQNDGNGNITMDFCSYQGRSLSGTVRGNHGTLAILHQNRQSGSGSARAQFDQDCRMELTVLADNRFTGRYIETQRNRNQALRSATVDIPECTTSFNFTMEKKAQS